MNYPIGVNAEELRRYLAEDYGPLVSFVHTGGGVYNLEVVGWADHLALIGPYNGDGTPEWEFGGDPAVFVQTCDGEYRLHDDDLGPECTDPEEVLGRVREALRLP